MTKDESGLTINKPKLLDAIDFETDIAPHPLVSIWAGVGAGKNYFIENLITGNEKYGIPRMDVLIITSRKAKVAETLSWKAASITRIIDDDKTFDDMIFNIGCDPDDHKKIIEDDTGLEMSLYQRSVICSNAYIEKYLQYRHHPQILATHLWNRFDVIVWDEAHALRTDSSYQHSPFHVMSLMSETYRRIKAADTNDTLPEDERKPEIKRPTCKHIIFMTGTPESIENIPLLRNSPILDVRETCFCVMPKNIHFLTDAQAIQQIKEQLRQDERIVYFSNHTVLPKELSEKYQLPSERIAVSFSKEEKRAIMAAESKALKEDADYNGAETEYDRMASVEAHLAHHSNIRSDIRLFFTTSRNKEGININDTDIRHIYIESHSMTDIKQMAGRIRAGAEHVYIILDSRGHEDTEEKYTWLTAKQLARSKNSWDERGLSQLNTNLKDFCKQHGARDLVSNRNASIRAYDDSYPEIGTYIDRVKKYSPYFEYDYIRNKFYYNAYREQSMKFYAAERKRFDDAANDPVQLIELFQKEFPEAIIHAHILPEDQARKLGWDFMFNHPDGFTLEELDELLARFDELLTSPQNRKRRKSEKPDPNRLLHRIGLHFRRQNNNPGTSGYSQYILEPHKKKSKAKAA